jgi:hypothetical protein
MYLALEVMASTREISIADHEGGVSSKYVGIFAVCLKQSEMVHKQVHSEL